jgi:hypothetical protein
VRSRPRRRGRRSARRRVVSGAGRSCSVENGCARAARRAPRRGAGGSGAKSRWARPRRQIGRLAARERQFARPVAPPTASPVTAPPAGGGLPVRASSPPCGPGSQLSDSPHPAQTPDGRAQARGLRQPSPPGAPGTGPGSSRDRWADALRTHPGICTLASARALNADARGAVATWAGSPTWGSRATRRATRTSQVSGRTPASRRSLPGSQPEDRWGRRTAFTLPWRDFVGRSRARPQAGMCSSPGFTRVA